MGNRLSQRWRRRPTVMDVEIPNVYRSLPRDPLDSDRRVARRCSVDALIAETVIPSRTHREWLHSQGAAFGTDGRLKSLVRMVKNPAG
jgi:hypothetical protein